MREPVECAQPFELYHHMLADGITFHFKPPNNNLPQKKSGALSQKNAPPEIHSIS